MQERAYVQSKKIIIMASRSQSPIPEDIPRESQMPAFGPGPYSAGEIRILNLLLDIKEKLGGMGHATKILEDTSKTHDERLLEVIREADKTASVLPSMQNTIARHDKDLNGLGKVAHTAKIPGYIALTLAGAIGAAFLTYLLRK
jgi:hypothetical protein